MNLLAFLVGLLGCQKIPDAEKTYHKVSDMCVLSMSSGHMDRSYSYSFTIMKEDGCWFLDAECFLQNHEVEAIVSHREVERKDMEELFEILEEHEIIAYAESYQKPLKSKFIVLDETMYSFGISFSDESTYNIGSTVPGQGDLEDFFYRLAEEKN